MPAALEPVPPRRVSRRTWLLIACTLVVGLAAAAAAAWWLIRTVLDEGAEFKAGSPSYWVLVPDELRAGSLQSLGHVEGYRYSAADGPKPVITVVQIRPTAPRVQTQAAVDAHFRELGFREDDQAGPRRGDTHLEVRFAGDCDRGPGADCRVTIALLEHLF